MTTGVAPPRFSGIVRKTITCDECGCTEETPDGIVGATRRGWKGGIRRRDDNVRVQVYRCPACRERRRALGTMSTPAEIDAGLTANERKFLDRADDNGHVWFVPSQANMVRRLIARGRVASVDDVRRLDRIRGWERRATVAKQPEQQAEIEDAKE